MRIIEFETKDDKIFGICTNGHKILISNEQTVIHRKRKKRNKEKIIVITKEQKANFGNINIITSEPCPKCGEKKAELVSFFTAHGDEDAISILKCLKCGKSFRRGEW